MDEYLLSMLKFSEIEILFKMKSLYFTDCTSKYLQIKI